MQARLKDIERKSAIQIVTELAASFTDKQEYLHCLECLALLALKDALCTVNEKRVGVSGINRAEMAFSRSAALLLTQDLEIQKRLNEVVCGREIT